MTAYGATEIERWIPTAGPPTPGSPLVVPFVDADGSGSDGSARTTEAPLAMPLLICVSMLPTIPTVTGLRSACPVRTTVT